MSPLYRAFNCPVCPARDSLGVCSGWLTTNFIHSEAGCEFFQNPRTVCGVIKCLLLSIRFNEKQKLRSHELPTIISEPEMCSICSRPAIVLCLSLRRLHLHISVAWQWPCSYSTLSGCLQNTAEQQTPKLPNSPTCLNSMSIEAMSVSPSMHVCA
jgi:hypothetical protein